jgi:hypothetical protein
MTGCGRFLLQRVYFFWRDGYVRARVRATADQTKNMVEVWFDIAPGASKADLWQEARDRVLSVLDPE